MHRLWGGDLIGMTAMPEAKLAREAEIGYALVALVTDYDCWRRGRPTGPGGMAAPAKPRQPADPAALLKEIIANLQAASDNAVALIRRAVERIAARPEELAAAPARDALKLAIWSDKSPNPARRGGTAGAAVDEIFRSALKHGDCRQRPSRHASWSGRFVCPRVTLPSGAAAAASRPSPARGCWPSCRAPPAGRQQLPAHAAAARRAERRQPARQGFRPRASTSASPPTPSRSSRRPRRWSG